MAETQAIQAIRSLRRAWRRTAFASAFFIAAATSFLCTAVLHVLFGLSYGWMFLWFALSMLIILIADQTWRISETDITRYLDKTYPELEESSALLLQPSSSLPFLQQLQVEKIAGILTGIARPAVFQQKIKRALIIATAVALIATILLIVPLSSSVTKKNIPPESTVKNVHTEQVIPVIATTELSIQPPAYTRKPIRHQQLFNLQAEEGALISWHIQTVKPVKLVQLVFNDSTVIQFQQLNANGTEWKATKTIHSSGFYQVKIDSTISELYQATQIKDEPPNIQVQTPKPNTVIDYGQPARISVQAVVTDDYGIKQAAVFATIASGSGEAVKFKEQQISFPQSFAAQLNQYAMVKEIDLKSLGMQPGDELYFYIKAVDNNNQEKRSDMLIVTIADTAQLMSMEELVNGINLKPEYFRSERQIIIETELLLKDKDTITAEAFKNRSNNLGIDQHLLRLRYGKFLGEESEGVESGVPQDNGLGDAANFGNAAKILDVFTDKHDNAEDASFFGIETRNQLKATLTEMWNAELRLRTFKPQEALPYEYKALRLLKDLQQKSRAYVAKTNLKTTPLKLDKRLSADLSKVIQPVRQSDIVSPDKTNEATRQALALLEGLSYRQRLTDAEAQVLQQCNSLVSVKAASDPVRYLASLQALRRILSLLKTPGGIMQADIRLVQKALAEITPEPVTLPFTREAATDGGLSEQYFHHLQKNKQP